MPCNKRSACQIKILRLHLTQKYLLYVLFCIFFLSVRRFGITQGLPSLCSISRFCFFAAILQTATALTKTRWLTKEPLRSESTVNTEVYLSIKLPRPTLQGPAKKPILYLPTIGTYYIGFLVLLSIV